MNSKQQTTNGGTFWINFLLGFSLIFLIVGLIVAGLNFHWMLQASSKAMMSFRTDMYVGLIITGISLIPLSFSIYLKSKK